MTPNPKRYRTDIHNNPTAFTTDIAKEAGLILGSDYEQGEPFEVKDSKGKISTLYTAKLLGDPIKLTLKVIDKLTFYLSYPYHFRWIYIAIPPQVWNNFNLLTKTIVIGVMYSIEGGTELKGLFPI